MAKINGKFAPITDELGYDPRFKELNQLEQLLYLLIIHTTHMTRHQAPTDPRYYQLQYGLKAKRGAIVSAMCRLTVVYPKLKCTSSGGIKTLSLLNSPTYKSQICLEEDIEEETEQEQESDRLSDWKKIEQAYPNKASITKAMQSFFASVNLKAEVVLRAIEKYKSHLAANPWKKPMNLDRFLTEIDAWINHIEPVKEETSAERDARILAKLKQ